MNFMICSGLIGIVIVYAFDRIARIFCHRIDTVLVSKMISCVVSELLG